MTVKVQLRRGTASGWTSANPTLSSGEIGIETDTGKIKIGNGSSSWTSLSYAAVTPSALSSDLSNYVATSTKGVANGVASLDASTLIPVAQIPSSIARSADVLSLSGGTLTGSLTLSGAPTNSLHAATKAYVDSVSEGLHIHASCVAATTTNIDLSTALENGDVLDGVTLATGNRVLVKNQTAQEQNGIYVVQASGAALRASDFNEPAEVDGGDFVFVTNGTVNGDTGWVQTTDTVVTIGTDPIIFTQFSGAGTYLAGNGLTLTGNTFTIDTSITANISGNQTLSNKTLSAPKFASGGEIDDENGNELIKFASVVPSAINELTITNAATGNNPIISATGGDTNISLEFSPKGSGVVKTNSSLTITGSAINIDGSTPSISSTATTAASIFTSNVSDITIGSSTVKTKAYPASGDTNTAAAGVGYMGMPQNSKSASYTLTAEDAGKHIYITSSGTTLTVPSNASVALPVGTTIVVINGNSVSTTIAITSDTLRLANSASTGSRTLASNGMATLLKINSTEWIASGNGLT